jgi:hypothetical protein
MPPIRRLYEKKEPFRDARFFVIVCEGGKRESDYFEFFDKLTPKIKLKTIESKEGKTSPKHLLTNALEALEHQKGVEEFDELWFVFDKDRWEESQIQELIGECKEKVKWNYAISNPCFEVWLYYHFKSFIPRIDKIDKCKSWKAHISEINPGGFSSVVHPKKIEFAIINSEINYSSTGYLPNIGSTQVHFLAKSILPSIKKFFEE